MFKIKNRVLLLGLRILICVFGLLPFSVYAQWTLNSNASSLYYVSSKVSAVSEINSFSDLSGAIDEQGNASLIIELDSVNSSVEVRDQRLRDILFQIANYPQAEVSLMLEAETLETIPSGLSITGSYLSSVTLHGLTQEVVAELQLTKLSNGAIQVQLAMPLIINADTFDLGDGIEELRELAGLTSINHNVVVDFSLLFERDK